jgi:hypothetical protein
VRKKNPKVVSARKEVDEAFYMEKDNAQFFVQYAKPILERYGV